MNTIFHEGELAVQQQAGVQQMASRVGKGIKSTIPPVAAQFLRERPFAIIGSLDDQKRVWVSLLSGGQQLIHSIDEQSLRISPIIAKTDILLTNLQANNDVGLLAIDFATRRRMRINGKARWEQNELVIHAEQVFANCPKYIQERILLSGTESGVAGQSLLTDQLSAEQADWIANADTFFIASANPAGGVDASHRGGNKGFIRVGDAQQLTWPDYSGNKMFNTLGNININPHVGLLFIDFESNRLLQLSGRAEIVWDETEVAQFVGAERLLTFVVDQVIETQTAVSFSWLFGSYSPHNP